MHKLGYFSSNLRWNKLLFLHFNHRLSRNTDFNYRFLSIEAYVTRKVKKPLTIVAYLKCLRHPKLPVQEKSITQSITWPTGRDSQCNSYALLVYIIYVHHIVDDMLFIAWVHFVGGSISISCYEDNSYLYRKQSSVKLVCYCETKYMYPYICSLQKINLYPPK